MNHRVSGQLQTLALLAVLSGAAVPAVAHHSFAMFDNTRTETISGTVYAFEWTNPHAWLWIDVDDGKGNDVKWGFEAAAPSEMSRSGWNKRILTPGEKVTVEYRPLKDGRPGGSLGKVIKSDGTVIGGHGPGSPTGPVGPPTSTPPSSK